ncbi:hypothetical protein HLRTI_000513 [Halorhabdus tiamatea SARL4B]|uniref:Uncharacterized protein n=1 Tax=Halorhabdus tiamatea SARL4B TaxID=1033806 RepID=U2FBV9_9EURY|nr:hypothetical protein HLRTI_000513 [Halorhabdus tiamatea SARL4B]
MGLVLQQIKQSEPAAFGTLGNRANTTYTAIRPDGFRTKQARIVGRSLFGISFEKGAW